MDVGFEQAGYDVQWANDFDQAACATYAANHTGKIVHGPIQELIPQLKAYSGVDMLFGGPPCQGFSVAGKMAPDDHRSELLWSFFDAVELVKPRAFVCENVKALAVLEKFQRVRRRMFERVEGLGYSYSLVILNARDFGVPQSRERMFLIGTKDRTEFADIGGHFSQYKVPMKTLREVLRPLGPAGSESNSRVCKAKITMAASPVMRRSPYAGMLFNGQGRPLNPDSVSSTLHASMGGNKTPIIDELDLHGDAGSWVTEYHASLLRGEPPLPFESAPERLRRLTVDEAIRIQTFPKNYLFPKNQGHTFKQIGNAVPCQLAACVASVAKNLLAGQKRPSLKPQLELSLV